MEIYLPIMRESRETGRETGSREGRRDEFLAFSGQMFLG